MKLTTIFAVLGLSVAALACSDDTTQIGNNTPPELPELPSDIIPDREGVTVKGCVTTTKGTKLAGVVVSDGVRVTLTDADGRYWLRTDFAQSEFVFVSLPSGFEAPVKEAMPVFYARLKGDKPVEQHDFCLTPADNDRHVMVVMTDMHIAGRKPSNGPIGGEGVLDSVQFRRDFIPALDASLSELPVGVKVYGLNLGDMTHDTFWEANGVSFPEYKSLMKEFSFPVFHVMGNHDYDCSVTNITGNDRAAEARYREALGPTYYSFNIGRIHYIVLDDMAYVNTDGGRDYACRLDDAQMAWLRQDMTMLPAGTERIVVALHVPTMRRNPIASKENLLANRDELYALLAGHQVTILSGHAHFSETVTISPSTTEYIHSSVCGSWWYVPVCVDGSPAGFSLYTADAGKLSRITHGWSEPSPTAQFRLYNQGQTNTSGNAGIVLNLWNWNEKWSIVCSENGSVVGQGAMESGTDALYQKLYDDKFISNTASTAYRPYKTDHLFRYTPKDPTAEIRIEMTDDQGRLHSVTTQVQ